MESASGQIEATEGNRAQEMIDDIVIERWHSDAKVLNQTTHDGKTKTQRDGRNDSGNTATTENQKAAEEKKTKRLIAERGKEISTRPDPRDVGEQLCPHQDQKNTSALWSEHGNAQPAHKQGGGDPQEDHRDLPEERAESGVKMRAYTMIDAPR